MDEEYQHFHQPVSAGQLELASQSLRDWRMQSYAQRRRDWVNQHSYFRHFWRAFGVMGAAVVVGLIAFMLRRPPLVEEAANVGYACAGYFAVWGIEYAVKWGWFAPVALENESQDRVETTLGLLVGAEASIAWHKKQCEHFQQAYLEVHQRLHIAP